MCVLRNKARYSMYVLTFGDLKFCGGALTPLDMNNFNFSNYHEFQSSLIHLYMHVQHEDIDVFYLYST